MVASPLTSPSELLLSGGLFGWSFALTYFIGATGLGFVAGGVTGILEDRGLLAGQARMRPAASGCSEGFSGSSSAGPVMVMDRTVRSRTLATRLRLPALAAEVRRLGLHITGYFLAYSTLGYLLIELLPSGELIRLLGDTPAWGVPLAAILGIPI